MNICLIAIFIIFSSLFLCNFFLTRSGTPVSTEVQEAAVKAAKSLPGDWTKTAEELLARLQTKNTEETESGSQKADTINSGAR